MGKNWKVFRKLLRYAVSGWDGRMHKALRVCPMCGSDTTYDIQISDDNIVALYYCTNYHKCDYEEETFRWRVTPEDIQPPYKPPPPPRNNVFEVSKCRG